MKSSFLPLLSILSLASGIAAKSSNLDVVGYWGVHGGNVGEKHLGYYCDTGAYTIINLAFISTLTNPHNLTAEIPSAASSNGDIVADIRHCQDKGVRIFISIGGYIADVPINNDATGNAYADALWNTFFGGKDSSYKRPFGSSVILDGLDLDLEQTSTSGYGALAKKLKGYFDKSGRDYWMSAAPQCGIPDPNMDTLLKTVWFDYVSPQFYNNWCFFTGPNMNYANVSAQYGKSWVDFASNFVNPKTKLLLGVPAPNGGNGGDSDVLPKVKSVVPGLAEDHPDLFGGVMFWDCFWAGPEWAKSIKDIVDKACGGDCKTTKPSTEPSPTVPSPKETTSSKKTSTDSSSDTSATPTTSKSAKTTTVTTNSTSTKTSTETETLTSASSSSEGSTPTSGPCSSSGQTVCANTNGSPDYSECVNGKWSARSCSPGTVCQSNGSGIFCGFKQKRASRYGRRLRA